LATNRPATPLFDGIHGPADLKRLERASLPKLAEEMRSVILDTISQTGGHLGSGMGVVELTIALHYLYDFADDRLVFDVGHQCYPHKLLTERKERFDTIRQKDGLSGFTNRFESPYDVYTMGHAGTAASAALGIAYGDRLQKRDRHTVAVVGDAAMGCGVAFEALNHAGGLENQRLLVILNDNRWSIAKTVGALSRYLDQVRSGPFYQRTKKALHDLIQSIPLIGKDLDQRLEDAAEHLRKIVVPGSIFEQLGFQYFGPVDGHDTDELLDYLTRIKELDGVTLLHVKTQKGKGVPGSEDRYDRAHAAKPQKKAEPKAEKPQEVPVEPCVIPAAKPVKARGANRKAWTKWFSEAVEALAEKDPRVVAITAAMPDGTGLMEFRDKFPDRFIDTGIAEQHAVAFASGLATSGLRPIAAIYSTFLQRGYDQVFQEVAIQETPVMFCLDRAGVVGEDGATHNGVFDIAYLRCLPGVTLMAPKDGPELGAMMEFALTLPNFSAIRYARGNAPSENDLPGWDGKSAPIELGKAETLRRGRDGAIIAYGHMVETAMETALLLEARGIDIEVVNARFAKPIDAAMVLDVCSRHDHVLTLEDHVLMGGFGSAVLEVLASNEPCRARVQVCALPDAFLEHASRADVMKETGLDAPSLATRLQRAIEARIQPQNGVGARTTRS
jgi:1-deoxy-D-xylulose-5-phosphate synthase